MSIFKIMSRGVFIGSTVMLFQVLHVWGHMEVTQIYLFGDTQSAPLELTGLYDTIKMFFTIPEYFFSYIDALNLHKTFIFTGIEGLMGISEVQFRRFLLYFTTFSYYFLLITLFGKVSTIFPIERDQKIFFTSLVLIYYTIIKLLGNM